MIFLQGFPSVVKKFMDRRGGRGIVSRFSVGIFLSHGAEKVRKRILQCIINTDIEKSWG